MGKLESRYGVTTAICILCGMLMMAGFLFLWPTYQQSGNLSALSDTWSEKSVHIGFPEAMEPQLYDGDAGTFLTNTLGNILEPDKPFTGQTFALDSDIYGMQLDTIKAGLQEGSILRTCVQEAPPILLEANASYELHKENSHWTIVFRTTGIQQFKLYSPMPVRIEGEGVTVVHQEEAQVVIVTRVGNYSPIDLYWSS
ncbi:hypothetical protein [Paenibacillus sp. UMB4589-SE434]|uniref:hypothetical protein n=1 Tax=Paenibacillus sp. UMB4589-SE434 TaxID=3046314 RepID=UPI00254C3960|nr:hypothetical protein [Paenibacillus sp. UMB4589-SE434]MDK8183830.1 hypothetical protein [Paenibacillus sp. UMB4589-SE434]